MKCELKSAALAGADAPFLIWGLVPVQLREWGITGMFVLESRGEPEAAFRSLFALQDRLQWVIDERAMALGEGVHPKYCTLRYHDFLAKRILPGSRVLGIGCGHGVLARSIAPRVSRSTVVGVELNEESFQRTYSGKLPANLSFATADACDSLPTGQWDVIVFSNTLDHIENLVGFLWGCPAPGSPWQGARPRLSVRTRLATAIVPRVGGQFLFGSRALRGAPPRRVSCRTWRCRPGDSRTSYWAGRDIGRLRAFRRLM